MIISLFWLHEMLAGHTPTPLLATNSPAGAVFFFGLPLPRSFSLFSIVSRVEMERMIKHPPSDSSNALFNIFQPVFLVFIPRRQMRPELLLQIFDSNHFPGIIGS